VAGFLSQLCIYFDTFSRKYVGDDTYSCTEYRTFLKCRILQITNHQNISCCFTVESARNKEIPLIASVLACSSPLLSLIGLVWSVSRVSNPTSKRSDTAETTNHLLHLHVHHALALGSSPSPPPSPAKSRAISTLQSSALYLPWVLSFIFVI
jgi:hypothetical protein